MNTCATGPLATRRTFSIVTQSKYSGTVCRSWWTTTTVLPACAQTLEQIHDRALGRGVHPLERLIHEVDLGILHQGAGQEDALLLAAGELADLAVGEVDACPLAPAPHGLSLLVTSRAADPAQRAVPAHHHHVQHAGGEIPVDAAALRDIARPGVAAVRYGPAVNEDLPRRRGHEPQGWI